MRLIIAAPANGAILKDALKAQLQNDTRVSSLVDLSSPEGSYPQLSFAAAEEVAAGRADRALLICGTGVGTAIAANKVRGIRAATAHDLLTLRGSVENYDAQVFMYGAKRHCRPGRLGIGRYLVGFAPRHKQRLCT